MKSDGGGRRVVVEEGGGGSSGGGGARRRPRRRCRRHCGSVRVDGRLLRLLMPLVLRARRPVGVAAGLCCFLAVVGVLSGEKGAPERRRRAAHRLASKNFVLLSLLLFPFSPRLPVPPPCPRASEEHAQTLQGQTAAGRACKTRAGAKERASNKSSTMTHAVLG